MNIYSDKRRNSKDSRVASSELVTMAVLGTLFLGVGIYYIIVANYKLMAFCLVMAVICGSYIGFGHYSRRKRLNLNHAFNELRLGVQAHTYYEFFEESDLDKEKFDTVHTNASVAIAYSISEDFYFELEVNQKGYYLGIEMTDAGIDKMDYFPKDIMELTDNYKEGTISVTDNAKIICEKFIEYIKDSNKSVDMINAYYEEKNKKEEIKND